MYNCPQVFVFDSQSLVIVQFRARSREHIKSQSCRIDCCVIPRETNRNIVNQCTMQYALYRLAWRGWVRLCATLDTERLSTGERIRASTELVIGRKTREPKWWSGEPEWLDEHGRPCPGPRGYARTFVHRPVPRRNGGEKPGGFFVWISEDRRHMLDDTLNCFT